MTAEMVTGFAPEYREYLFAKNILVNDTGENREECVKALFALANVFGIRITQNPHLATWGMVELAEKMIGRRVPEPFYRGFPRSVLMLTQDQLLMDQIIHYAVTYGLGDFSQPGHSLFEKNFDRIAFSENTKPKDFAIVEPGKARDIIAKAAGDLLQSTRPLNEKQEKLVALFARECPERITECRSKDTAIRLIDETRDVSFARFLKLPDVIRMAEDINQRHGLPSIMKEYWEEHRKYEELMAARSLIVERNREKQVLYNREMAAYQDGLKQYEARKKAADEWNRTLLGRLFPNREKIEAPVKPSPPVTEPVPYMPVPVKRTEPRTIRHLNLKNQDRKLISGVIDYFFDREKTDIRDCFEKKRAWCGLLHHIHYVPKNERARAFVTAMRTRQENPSAAAAFEKAVASGDISGAAKTLVREKGRGAVIRQMDYLLSRAPNQAAADAVMEYLSGSRLIMLYQTLMHYCMPGKGKRTFMFVRNKRMHIHTESDEEASRRGTQLPEETRDRLARRIGGLIEKRLKQKSIGRVYIAPGMERIALPLQEATSTSGFGVLPRGSRIPIPEGSKVRCFTYWEKVNDIDLACFGLQEEGDEQIEFSWRTMHASQSQAVTFSGDETSGYSGGSEYFDISILAFREKYPAVRYIVFTDNVFSRSFFSAITCTAGFMIREEEDSGAVFEPKAVRTSFAITGKSTFACLFALDLVTREMVWLNMTLSSSNAVAGTDNITVMRRYFALPEGVNLAGFFTGMATEVTFDPSEADIIVADDYEGPVRENQTLIRSCDFDKVLAYLNKE